MKVGKVTLPEIIIIQVEYQFADRLNDLIASIAENTFIDEIYLENGFRVFSNEVDS